MFFGNRNMDRLEAEALNEALTKPLYAVTIDDRITDCGFGYVPLFGKESMAKHHAMGGGKVIEISGWANLRFVMWYITVFRGESLRTYNKKGKGYYGVELRCSEPF